MSGRVLLSLTSTKQGLMCLAQGHNAVTRLRLEPAALQYRAMHFTTVLPLGGVQKTQQAKQLIGKSGEEWPSEAWYGFDTDLQKMCEYTHEMPKSQIIDHKCATI